MKVFPARFNLIQSSHIGHGAAGAHVGQDYLLMTDTQDIRAFCHEVNAAENDVFGVLAACRPLCQFERISADVSEFDNLIALVVMSQNDQTPAKPLAGLPDPFINLDIVQPRYRFGQNRLKHKAHYRSTQTLSKFRPDSPLETCA